MQDWILPDVRVQKVPIEFKNGIELFIKREDEIHPDVSGNKFRKLKYNLIEAKKLGKESLLTFGGAYSNHISAVASAGKMFGFETIGVIRGEELHSKINENPTLSFAKSCGMQFLFVSREEYRQKHTLEFQKELGKYLKKDFYLLPEGGTNNLAVKGCEEIITENERKFDIITTAVGTGGTISGIINASYPHQKVYGFPALRGEFLEKEIPKFTDKTNWQLIHDYHFGGYAKTNDELIDFINDFYKKTQIPLDPIYTGKMIFGIFALVKKDFFPSESKILAIHTGGLQGIKGFNQRRKEKFIEI